MKNDDPIIKIRHLHKVFGNHVALKHLDLEIAEGTVFGLIGPNGAGKTTTIDILATLLWPSAGWAMVCGYNLLRDQMRIRRAIGYMPDPCMLYEDMKVHEYLGFFADIYGIDKQKRIICNILEIIDLGDKVNSYIGQLSRGMRQRLSLGRCLIHDPKILLLDEPAAGLDPGGRQVISALLKELRSMGKTIFIASHILKELMDICDTVGVIENGALVLAGSIDELRRKVTNCQRVEVKVGCGIENAIEILERIKDVASFWTEDNSLRINFTGTDEELAALFKGLMENHVQIESFVQKEVTLEDIFMAVTEA